LVTLSVAISTVITLCCMIKINLEVIEELKNLKED